MSLSRYIYQEKFKQTKKTTEYNIYSCHCALQIHVETLYNKIMDSLVPLSQFLCRYKLANLHVRYKYLQYLMNEKKCENIYGAKNIMLKLC